MRHIPAFWAVMLAGRDHSSKVNMTMCIEEYNIPAAVAKHHGPVRTASTVTLKLPFLMNTEALEDGDLLVLPFDGGNEVISCDSFPAISPNKE